jgi:preprotein translocase subunit SecA
MLQKVLTKVFGSKQDRDMKLLQPIVDRINQLEPEMQRLSDAALQSKTPQFRERLDAGESLDALLPEAFAAVREAGVRTLNQRHYDVQLMGGVVFHQGKIAEMKTGEGKTLTSTLAVYLNALAGKGAHVVTVNDYLAKRDAEWMGKIYTFLGLSVGLTYSGLPHNLKALGYKSDITYGVHSEFGFDYLWDNKGQMLEEKVQRGHHYAIVDEVDSILIDEARTPLIIAEPQGEPVELYKKIDTAVRRLQNERHYERDEKSSKRGTVALTEEGVEEIERLLGVEDLYGHESMNLVHHVNQALIAHILYKRDVDYVLQGGEVIIVDEFTGRLQEGRRFNEGLHQALEAKERVRIKQENQTGASITYQNYFRMYKKLAGMTGTAETEAAEFAHVYGLDVVVVPTNEPMIRIDNPDVIYKTEGAKYRAVLEDIIEKHEQGRPVLVGTISIENSEKLSQMLRKKRRDIKHQVLNAKEHAHEATIIAQAGVPGNVTIATNMAGRGVDILLGGNPEGLANELLRKKKVDPSTVDEDSAEWKEALAEAEAVCAPSREQVLKAGGLHIIATERHEARRIDNQLRGRAGRQGDPGSSRFYLSLEDDLMRKFGSERLSGIMDRLGMEEDIPIEHKAVTNAIEKAQKRVEQVFFEMRKNRLKFDDVMNSQRQSIYSLRDSILEGNDLKETIWEMIENVLDDYLEEHLPEHINDERLSSIRPEFQNQLDSSEPLPADMLQELRTNGLALSENITVSTSKKGSEWLVSDDEDQKTYVIRKEGDQLNVYDGTIEGFKTWQANTFTIDATDLQQPLNMSQSELREYLLKLLHQLYEQREVEMGSELMRTLERLILLDRIDHHWKDHLYNIDYIEEGIYLRGYAGKDPIVVFKNEAFSVFEAMHRRIEEEVSEYIFKARIETTPLQSDRPRRASRRGGAMNTHGAIGGTLDGQSASDTAEFASRQAAGGLPKVGRNAPCPCGSGKKYKRCHGK